MDIVGFPRVADFKMLQRSRIKPKNLQPQWFTVILWENLLNFRYVMQLFPTRWPWNGLIVVQIPESERPNYVYLRAAFQIFTNLNYFRWRRVMQNSKKQNVSYLYSYLKLFDFNRALIVEFKIETKIRNAYHLKLKRNH